jgi:predicted ester cyclase
VRTFTVVPGHPHTWPGMPPAARTVAEFLSMVRVTGDTGAAERLMSPSVPAHQHVAERDETLVRSPDEYAAHVRDMLQDHGPFRFEVRELIVEQDHVFVRWLQHGRLRSIAGPHPATRPLREAGSAVYRVADGRIQEYWIQLDRLGEHLQR